MVRTKPGMTLAGLIVGSLLGAGGTAWQTREQDAPGAGPCWGALTDADLKALGLRDEGEGEGEDLTVQEVDPWQGDDILRNEGQCRLVADQDREVAIRVHAPGDMRSREKSDWHTKFLNAGMTPLGGEFVGMASSDHAWLALPTGCGGGSDDAPPTVVDVDTGLLLKEKDDSRQRRALARIASRVANVALDKLGCDDGAFTVPRKVPSFSAWKKTGPDGFCGIEGLTTPLARLVPKFERRTSPAEPVRICAVGPDNSGPELEFVTVQDPGIAQTLTATVVEGSGISIESEDGHGTLGEETAAFRVDCQTGPVVFLLVTEHFDGDRVRAARTLLPRFVAGEAERIGCGKVRMEIPEIGSPRGRGSGEL